MNGGSPRRHSDPLVSSTGTQNPLEGSEISTGELHAIIRLVYEKSGITLSEEKQTLIVGRLGKRLRTLRLKSYRDYLRVVAADQTGAELSLLLDAIATNHTSFFREPKHFAFLTEHILPHLGNRGGSPIEVWSAACSSGEEPYTIAITMQEAGCDDFRLLASDLSTKALAAASAGVYRMSDVKTIPPPLLRKYFERGLGKQEGLARVSHDLRHRVEFKALNLLEVSSLGRQFDVIFCRNVMIYFDQAVQQRVVSMLERHLTPGGYLFIAHAESLNGIRHSLRSVAPAIFRQGVR